MWPFPTAAAAAALLAATKPLLLCCSQRQQVYLARNKETGQEVVIKMIERGPAVSKHVESELLIHRCVC